jgi:hypothetical protein
MKGHKLHTQNTDYLCFLKADKEFHSLYKTLFETKLLKENPTKVKMNKSK